MSDSYDDYEAKIQLAEYAWEKRVGEMVKTKMDREDIIKLARGAGLAYGSDEKPLNSVTRFAFLVAKHECEKLAAWMMSQGYATGHGDSTEDLLKELEWQIEERIRNEREACAKICADLAAHREVGAYGMLVAHSCANEILARGQA